MFLLQLWLSGQSDGDDSPARLLISLSAQDLNVNVLSWPPRPLLMWAERMSAVLTRRVTCTGAASIWTTENKQEGRSNVSWAERRHGRWHLLTCPQSPDYPSKVWHDHYIYHLDSSSLASVSFCFMYAWTWYKWAFSVWAANGRVFIWMWIDFLQRGLFDSVSLLHISLSSTTTQPVPYWRKAFENIPSSSGEKQRHFQLNFIYQHKSWMCK